MKLFDDLSRAFLINFFRHSQTATWIMVLIGAVTVFIACLTSTFPIEITVRSKIPLALLTNTICAILIIFKLRNSSFNRLELISNLEGKSVKGSQALKKYGLMIFGYLILLFWGGWLMCGIVLIVFMGGKS